MTPDFDLTLIGARYPQLALGTLMAKRGHRVLIVHLDSGQGKPSSGGPPAGYIFRKRPTPLFGLDGDGLLRRFLDEIGIGRMLVQRSYPVNPVSYQVVLPRHRINVYSKRDRLLEELRREFPSSIDAFRTFFSELDDLAALWYEDITDLDSLEKSRPAMSRISSTFRGNSKARGMSHLLGDLGRTPGGEAGFAAVQHHFLGSYPLDASPDPLALALIHNIGRRGTFQEPAGTSSLADLMRIRFEEFGGEIKTGFRATAVKSRGGNGVTLVEEGGAEVHTRTLSTTADIASMIQGLNSGRKNNSHQSAVLPVRFFLGLDDSIVPVGMEDNLFCLREDRGGPLGLKALYIALSPSGSEMAPEGKRSMTVTGLVSGTQLEGLTDERVSPIHDDLIQTLETMIPFLNDGLDFIHSDLMDNQGAGLPRPLGGGLLSWFPALIGRSRVRSIRRGRITILSLPPRALGMEGETLMALAAAGSLGKILGKGRH
jgi:phytoene dehydrogenase-like protein